MADEKKPEESYVLMIACRSYSVLKVNHSSVLTAHLSEEQLKSLEDAIATARAKGDIE